MIDDSASTTAAAASEAAAAAAAAVAPPRHLLTPEMRAHFDAHGWVVVPGVVTREACAQYIDRLWTGLEGMGTGLRRDDPATWEDEARWPANVHNIIQQFGVGQWQAVWDVREACSQVFAEFWGTERLVSSLDGIGVVRPPERTGRGWRRGGHDGALSWLHADQSGRLTQFECVQGLCNLVDATEQDSSLLVVPRSHLAHAELCARWGYKGASDWVKLTEAQRADVRAEVEAGRLGAPLVVAAPAGSVVLWDSRTFHQNVYPKRGREHADRWRWVVYVCQAPRAGMTTRDVERKRKLMHEGRMSNHWPHKRFRPFSVAPRTYSREAQEAAKRVRIYTDRQLTPAQERLACLRDYPSNVV
jgi:hypothetical protein